ncbi:hypothetical protein ACX0HA_04675 [Flavobacterium hauense]
MKKLLFAFMAMTLFACSSDDSAPVNPDNGNPENPNPVECTNVYTGNVWLKTQAEVDAFASNGYCKIDGVLSIGVSVDGQPPANITDISALSGLVSVSEKILVLNTSLTSLNGLQNIKNLQRIDVLYNSLLTSVQGSPSIVDGGSVYINSNVLLTGLQGLMLGNSLLTLNLDWNKSLSSLAVGDTCQKIKWLFISQTSATSLEGLEGLTEAEVVYVKSNPNLVSLKGLENITKVGSLAITSNPLLTSIEHLSGITSITALPYIGQPDESNFSINDNDNLTSLHGLENVASYGGYLFFVIGNDNLTDFCAIKNMLLHANYLEDYSIYDNAYNPSIWQIEGTQCSQP